MKPKDIFTVGILLLVAIVLSSCAGKQDPAPIKVVVLPYMSNAPFFIADAEGFFKEQGLTLEFVEMTRNAETIPVINQGDVDVVAGSMSAGFFNAVARGANLKFVAEKAKINTSGCGSMEMLASNAFLEAHPSKNPEDLKGALILSYSGSFSGYYLQKYLDEANLSSRDDIEGFRGTQFDAFQALQENTLDIMLGTEPWPTMVLQGGYGGVWAEFKDIVPGSSYAQVWYGPTFLEDNPEIGERFMIGFLKGVAQYQQGMTDRNVEIIVEYTGLDESIVRAACWNQVSSDGMINIPDMLGFQEWAVENGVQDEIIPVEKFWDPHFIEYAAKELGLP